MELGYLGKGAFPLPADALLPLSQPRLLGASSQPRSASFLRQKGHRQKANNPAQHSKDGKKKPRASMGSGEKRSLIIHEGWLGRSRPLAIPTYQPELLLLPKRAPFICFRLLH